MPNTKITDNATYHEGQQIITPKVRGALRDLSTESCENVVGPRTCRDDPSKSADAPYEADSYCWTCRIRAAFDTEENPVDMKITERVGTPRSHCEHHAADPNAELPTSGLMYDEVEIATEAFKQSLISTRGMCEDHVRAALEAFLKVRRK